MLSGYHNILEFSLEKFCLTRSLASLFDSSKSSVHIGIAPFLPQEIAIINYSTLHQKWTLLIHIYPHGIDTDPITYPIDACRRQRSTPMLSHIPHRRTEVPCSHICAYTPHHLQNIQNIKSFISNKNTRILQQKGCAMSHAWSYGESSSDKWPIIDSNKSEAYPGTILMIKYWGRDECELFGFDFEAGDERL